MEFKFKKKDWKIAIIAVLVAAIVIVMVRTPFITQASDKVMDVLSSISGDVSGDISGNASGKCGKTLTWTLYYGTLTISGSGDMYDYDERDIPWDDYSDCVKYIEIEKNVTSIGCEAFAYLENLKSVEFESGSQLDSIGDYAFYDCTKLKKITVPSSVTYIGDAAIGMTYDDDGDDMTVPGFVITGYLGSDAQIYAKEYDISFVKNGVISPKTIKITKSSYTYTGKKVAPKVKVINAVGNTVPAANYTVKYTNNVNTGTAKITVTFAKDYRGFKALTKSFKITKASNTMKLKTSAKKFKVKTKKQTCTISLKTKAKGKVTYTLSKAAKKAKIKVSSKGKVTVPKNCKKGTYKIVVKAAGNKNYKAASKTFKVIVK